MARSSLTALSAAHHQAIQQLDGIVSAPVTPTREVLGRASPVAVKVTPPKKKVVAPMAVRTTVAGMPPLRALSAYNFYFRDERGQSFLLSHRNHLVPSDFRRSLIPFALLGHCRPNLEWRRE